jgi:hypothetical protein
VRYLPALILLVSTHVYGGFIAIYEKPPAPKASIRAAPDDVFFTSSNLMWGAIACPYVDADKCLDGQEVVFTNEYAARRRYTVQRKGLMYSNKKQILYYILEVSKQ